MRLGEHRDVLPLLGIVVQLLNQFLDKRVIYLFQCLLDRERHTRIVDVLGSESEVNELLEAVETTHGIELLLDKVLHGLHVVVSHFLNILHPLGISKRKLTIDIAELVEQLMVDFL